MRGTPGSTLRLAAVALVAAAAPSFTGTGGQAPAAPPADARGALARGTLAVTDVHVVPMTADTVLRGHTVLVRDGRVVAVGPAARVRVPAGARTIDGRGKWLIPGLADMHTQLFS